MHVRNLLASVALTFLLLFTCSVSAQDDFSLDAAPEEEEEEGAFVIYDSDVELGVGYTTSDSFKFREYNGLPSQGGFAIANGRIRGRAPADSETPYYFDVTGTNLGLSSRYVRGEFGNQGEYSVYAEYNQVPHLRFDDGATPYRGAGGNNLTLPDGWVASDTTAGLTTLLPDLGRFDVETERRQIGAGFNRTLNRQWNVDLSFHHEDKEGTDTIGSVFATNGGNTLGATLPKPVDFKTDRLNLGVNYAGESGQFRVGYEFSYFDNRTETLQFQNAFVNPSWAPGAGFPTGVGEFALAPDNLAHNLFFSGGYNFPARTRVTFNASFSRYEQDESFLPYSANSSLTVNTPVPRSSAEAEVNNYLVNLAVSSRPVANWDLRGGYRYFNRDNNTPRDVFVRIVGDAEDQPAGVANDNARINLPYSLDQHEVKLGAGYRIFSRTKLSVGYEFDRTHRDYQEVDYTTEHALSAKLRSNPMANVNGWVQFTHTRRDNSGYQGNAPFLESHTPEYLATLPPGEQFENDPGLRKYYLADLEQNAVRAVLSYTPAPAWGLTVDANYLNGDYTDSPVGLQNRKMASGTLDVSYSPNEASNTHAFITYENRKYDQLGCQFNPLSAPNGACITAPPAQQRQWTADTADDVITAGLGGEWKIGKKWRFGMDYLFTKSTTNIDVTGGAELQPLSNLPRLDSLRHRLGLRLDYQFRKQLSFRMSYLFEHLDSEDFALDQVDPNGVAELITLGNRSPDYDAHVFGISLAYQWD
jgi:MtrB/PioB family decaheme-associated outer membrane protein